MIQDSPRETICIVYWGKRGGGRLLTEQIFQAAHKSSIRTLLFLRPRPFRANDNQIGIINVYRWLMERRKLIQTCSQSNVKIVIFPMASPWDIFLRHSLNKIGVDVKRIIHDATRHPGDYFPTNFWIRWLINDANKIVTLSNFVSDELISKYGIEPEKIYVSSLPSPIISQRPLVRSGRAGTTYLFLGRSRTYKGLELLLNAWPMVGDDESQLIIAGEGHKIQRDVERVQHIDRWLEDSEIIELMAGSTAVILPYLEASQSGLIPIAQTLGIPVIVTPVGGLKEQVSDGFTGIVTEDISKEALVKAMNSIKTFTFKPPSEDSPNAALQLLQVCLK